MTGGYVYRGADRSLRGKYFFLDSRNSASTSDDNYWMFDPADPFGTVQNIDSLLAPDMGLAQFPVSFGEDAAENLYIAYIASGEVYRIQTTIPGDFDGDGDVDTDDLNAWNACVSGPEILITGTTCQWADFDDDNDVDQSDFGILQRCLSGTNRLVDPHCAD